MDAAGRAFGYNTPSMYTLEIEGVGQSLRVVRYDGYEGMNELYEFNLDAVGDGSGAVEFADAVGKPATFRFYAGSDEDNPRVVHGIVRRFEQSDQGSSLTMGYRICLVPAAWRLCLRKNNRMFQSMKVGDILAEVLGDAGISDHTLSLNGSYATREYCVQYRESDWDFINRLMEEEGICYFFEHGDSVASLIIGDSSSVHEAITGEAEVPFRDNTGALESGEHISRLNYGEEVRPGKITMRDYNFTTPTVSLESSSSASLDDDLELYEYPGNYADGGAGGDMVSRRLEAHQTLRQSGVGNSCCPRLCPGHTFDLIDHARDSLNRGYLICRVSHRGSDPHYESAAVQQAPYSNRFWVIPSDVVFRPLRKTPRPAMQGIQTAVVVGPSGEEIHTDEHGRIKVQFHWDRKGANDENSSCWVRVKQSWAGPGWGALFIPRIGHEVVVDFIEGNPDRPLVTGSVYHAANVPPYSLPDEKTKSTIKTATYTGGGGSNELRFEDQSGSEEIYLHGQKDYNIHIENDKTQVIGNDEALQVVNDKTIHIGHDRDKTVDNDQSEAIGGNKTIEVAGNHTESIHANEEISIGGNESLEVAGDRQTSVAGAHSESVGASQDSSVALTFSKNVGVSATLNVGTNLVVSTGGASTENVNADKTMNLSGNYATTVAEGMTLNVGKDFKEEVADNRTMISGKKFSIQCGSASVSIEKNGNITIEGKNITIKGSGPMVVEGKKLDVKSSGTVNVNASGKVKVKGSNVALN